MQLTCNHVQATRRQFFHDTLKKLNNLTTSNFNSPSDYVIKACVLVNKLYSFLSKFKINENF